MGYFAKHRLITLTLLIQLIALPLLLIITREPQSSQGKAAPSTTISYSPDTTINSPLNLQKDEYFSPAVLVEPGPNLITEAKIEIFYDPAKVELVKSAPITINSDVFSKTAANPVFSRGKIELTIAVDNPAKGITERVKAVTLYFKALENAPRSYIYFGKNTKLFGVADPNLNILQESLPLIISISTPSAEPQSGSYPKK